MIKENGTILIPFDFSSYSMVGLMNSYNIARFTKSKIVLINSIKHNEEVNHFELQNLCKKIFDDINVKCEYESVFKEDLLSKILKLSIEFNATLIIMGLNPTITFNCIFGILIRLYAISN